MLLALRAFAPEREFDRFWFELGIFCRSLDDLARDVHFDVDQFSTNRANCVIMSMRRPVKTARAVAELYLSDVARIFKITERVVNGREADTRQ